jgi:AcrR family transcriptional regulator
MLHEVGYASTTIEGIAARAGVGKTTIYRWWPSKGALLGEALASVLRKGPEQETGNLRRDLVETIAVTIDNYTGEGAEMILIAFAAHVERDGGLLASFREGFLAERRRHGHELLQRAIARGELPADADIEMLMDIWAGTILYRSLITGEALPPDLPEQLTDLLLSGTIPRVRPKRAAAHRRAAKASSARTT